jgi:hypothetical protein
MPATNIVFEASASEGQPWPVGGVPSVDIWDAVQKKSPAFRVLPAKASATKQVCKMTAHIIPAHLFELLFIASPQEFVLRTVPQETA